MHCVVKKRLIKNIVRGGAPRLLITKVDNEIHQSQEFVLGVELSSFFMEKLDQDCVNLVAVTKR